MSKPVCAVVGVGPGNGAAFVRRFAAAGYAVAMLARRRELMDELAKSVPDARAFPCDVGDAASVESAFQAVRAALGEVEVVVYNAGSGRFATVEDITAADLESAFRVNTLGAFLVGQQVIPAMKRAGKGAFVFIGATASLRGGAKTAAFAAGKAAQRSLAQSMARHLWPAGVHVSLVIVDAMIDIPSTRKAMPGVPDTFFARPDDIAESVLFLTQQKPSAWSFEIEARPFGERW